MEAQKQEFFERALRVKAPVMLSFQAGPYAVREYATNISESGAFLPTARACEPGLQGTVTFKGSQFDQPLALEARVARVALEADASGGTQAGLGLQFVDPTDGDLARLRKLVEGVRSGTVVEAIRRSIRESGETLAQVLRARPADQKMMLALTATGEEITALIRDGHPSVLMRLLECPRVNPTHVVTMLRNPNLSTRVLSAIKRHSKFLANQEVRFLFAAHQNAMLAEAMEQLKFLPPDRLRRIGAMPQVKTQVRSRANELSRKGNASRPGLKPLR
jgi:hypothetical protein